MSLTFSKIFRGNAVVKDITLCRAVGGELRSLSPGAPERRGAMEAALVPMRSLSVAAFSFPFSNVLKVREALRLQVLPYAPAGGIELFPTVLERTGHGAGGVVWYASSDDLDVPASDSGRRLIWPAPLPLVSGVEGTGVTLWMDEENICSILWHEDRPILSRWRPRARTTAESELAWFDRYCAERQIERGASFVLDAADPKALLSLDGVARASLARCPWLGTVNLSRTALEGAMGLERGVRLMTRAACWILVMGLLVLGGQCLRWERTQRRIETVRGRSEALYREAFDPAHTGRISNPVTLARDRIAEIQRGSSDGRELEDVLTDLGAVFEENPSMDITVDVLRYNAEGLECTGSAPDMSTVLTFRRAWEERASLSQLDNTQSVSGVGYRFDLRVRW